MVAEMEAALEALNQGLQDAMDEQVRALCFGLVMDGTFSHDFDIAIVLMF